MIEYRRADLNDVDELVHLRIDFLKEIQNIESDNSDSNIKQSLVNYFNSAIANNSFIAWLALNDNKIVATSGICFYTLPPSYNNRTGNVTYIMNMYTQPGYRNMGIATYLFSRIIDEAAKLGYKKLCLHTTEKGKPLYIKYGFKDTDNEMILSIE